MPPGYRLRGGDLRCWRHVVPHPAVYRRSLATALLVGTILTTINQGNLILSHGFTHEILLKMGLTYCVPFAVSTSGALGAARIRRLVVVAVLGLGYATSRNTGATHGARAAAISAPASSPAGPKLTARETPLVAHRTLAP